MILIIYVSPVFAVEWQTPQTSNAWKGLWGQADDNAIYTGMWTRHLRPNGNNNNNTNRMLGINFKGIFLGEFVNSFYKRAYTAGVQRIVYSQKFEHHFQFDIGYRLGLIWGYKGTNLFGGQSVSFEPLPFPQLIVNVSWELLGFQLGYCVAVVTAGFFIKV